MLNIRLYLATVAVLALACYGWGLWQQADGYADGWVEGRKELLTDQLAEAEKLRKENTQRQQADDTKAAAVEKQGEAKTVTITKELIRYVQIPGRNVCQFDDRRLRIKADAAANSSNLPGFDDSAMQDAASGK